MTTEGGRQARVIADVRARDGEAQGRLDVALRTLRDRGFDADLARVDGAEAAREAARRVDGDPFVVCVGDDPAIDAVVDGLLTSGRAAPTLGVMAAHAGCDFVRTFGIPPNAPEFAAERLVDAPLYPIDVMKVTYVDDSGATRTTHVVGVLQAGLIGAAVRMEQRLPTWLGRFRYFGAFWAKQVTFRVPSVRIRGESRTFEGPASEVVVGNCQWTRGGVRISPRSFPGDGFLDLMIWTGPKSDAFRLLPKMFQGEHVPHDRIREHRARHIHVDAGRPLPVEADGVWLGFTPLTVELLREAVVLRI